MIKNLIHESHRLTIAFNKFIGHTFVPNIKARFLDNSGGFFIKTNSLGFRSDIEFKNKKKKLRILFFGDSNTAADGVSNKDRYSDIIGRNLNVEVFNFAIPGTGTDQQFLTWQTYAKKIEADLIIIGSLVENIERNKVSFRETISYLTKKSTLTAKPYFEISNKNLILKNFPVKKFNGNFKKINKDKVQWFIPSNQKFLYKILNLIRNSKLYNFLNNRFADNLFLLRSLLIKFFYQPYKDYKNPNSQGYMLLKKILEKFIFEIKKNSNIPIILMPIPTFHYYFDKAKPIYQDFYRNFDNKKNNIYVIDPLEKLKNLSFVQKKKISLPNDKGHLSQVGHKIIANFLKKKIIDLKILKLRRNQIIKNTHTEFSNTKKPNYILGISAFYHDSSATLLRDGEIVAAVQEERFTRKKNDKSFPKYAINYCLEEAEIEPNDLKAVVYYDNTYSTFERTLWSFHKTFPKSKESWLKYIPGWTNLRLHTPSLIRKNLNYNGKILHNQHHRSHLASAFFPSPFKESAILTIDGVGEWATASIGVGKYNKIKMLKEMSYPNSVGLLYSSFTEFLGFKVNSGEYKVMGLAPYGKPIYYDLILEKLILLREDGSIKINQEYFSYLEGTKMTNQKFANLFGGKSREPETEITAREMDIASSIQKVTEKIIHKMAIYAKKITGLDNLCMSGGVALNCVANGFLLKTNLFKNIWVQPASGDAGSSLGCAYDAYYSYFKKKRNLQKNKLPLQQGSLFGPAWSNIEIKSFLESANINYRFYGDEKKRNKIIAKNINAGKVIGLFNGRAEFGPRALGCRSIIGDPRNKEMQSKINLKIKFRESFRPFAPSILKEKVNEFFDLKKESPYMMLVAPLKKNKRFKEKKRYKKKDIIEILKELRSEIPAVTHVDYSARVQTVEKKYNKNFYNIIKEFYKLSNCPLVINTSFNVRGEPIVNSPLDAYICFLNTKMDILILEDYIIEKKKQKNLNLQILKSNNFKINSNKKHYSMNNEIKKIYLKLRNIKFKDQIYSLGWEDTPKFNKKEIFEIPKVLDQNIVQVDKFCKSVLNYWKNKNFKDKLYPVVLNLLKLSKKNKIKINSIEDNVDRKIYEMF